jgi:hypothetical protein
MIAGVEQMHALEVSGVLRRYLDHLAQCRLDDVVVVGGAVRDTLLGLEPRDLDVAVIIELPDSQMQALRQGIAAGQPIQALNRQHQLLYRIEQAVERRSRLLALSGGWRSPARDGTFERVPVQFSFLSCVIDGCLVNLSRSAIFSVDMMAIDHQRRLYQAAGQDGPADLAARRLRVARPGWNDVYGPKDWTVWTLLRALRYEYQYGFTFAFDPQLLEQAVNQPPPLNRPSLAELRKIIKLELFLASLDPTLKRTHHRYALRRVAWYLRHAIKRSIPREYRLFDAFLASVPPQRIPEAVTRLTQLGVFRTYPELAARTPAIR